MAKPPNFIGTSATAGPVYVSSLASIPAITIKAPIATAENAARGLVDKLPAPITPGTKAAQHASINAVDRLKDVFGSKPNPTSQSASKVITWVKLKWQTLVSRNS